MTIKTIRAKSGDSECEDVYRLLVITHRMAGAMACEKIGNWHLARTATFDDFVLTEWTNGIINITAETNKWYSGDEHIYTLSAVKQEE
jgi:hypothetical protein